MTDDPAKRRKDAETVSAQAHEIRKVMEKAKVTRQIAIRAQADVRPPKTWDKVVERAKQLMARQAREKPTK
jgi:hypothetical protein